MSKFIWNDQILLSELSFSSTKPWQATGIHFDSRAIKQDEIFFALETKNRDGHDYVKSAFANGAACAVVSHEFAKSNPDMALIPCKKPIDVMHQMAKLQRKRVNAKYIGITGSIGKTSAKDMIKLALSSFGNVFASIANFNNHIGVAFNLCNMPLDTDFAIIEMGMDKKGEIRCLSKICQPQFAIITNIESAHIEKLGSLENIAQAKAEIFEGMEKDGTILLNADNIYSDMLEKIAKKNGLKKFLYFGEGKKANAKLLKTSIEDNFTKIIVEITKHQFQFKLNLIGKHHGFNSVIALCLIDALNLDLNQAIQNLKHYELVDGRGKVHQIQLAGKNFSIIDDSYNAHPVSVNSALENLGHMQVDARKIAVLANMNELGEDSILLHQSIKQAIEANKIDKVITMGNLMKHLYDSLNEANKIDHFDNIDQLSKNIEQYFHDKDIVLFKGSYGTNLKNYVKELVKNYAI